MSMLCRKPRVGDHYFARLHNSLVRVMITSKINESGALCPPLQLPNAFRVSHRHDMVVDLFPRLNGYRHERRWVFFDNSMQPGAPFLECINPEDPHCADHALLDAADLAHDHRWYFGVLVTQFGKDGCRKTANNSIF